MFGKKKMKRDLDAYQAAVVELAAASEKKLAEAKSIPDAGERYEALVSFERKLTEEKDVLDSDFHGKAYKSTNVIGTSGGVLMLASIFTVIGAATGGATILGAALIAGVSGIGVGGSTLGLAGHYQSNVETKKDALPDLIAPLLADARKNREDILSKDLKGVAASARFDVLYEREEVKKAFTKAVTRQKILGDESISKLDKKKFGP